MTDTKKAKLWIKRKLLGDPTAKQLKRELCPRDYCAMYRAEPIKKFNLLFTEHDKWLGYTAGETMYYQLKEKDYHAEVINTAEMMKYMVHLAHATAGLRPEERRLGHRRAQKKSERRIRRFFNSKLVKELKNDDRLDK